MELLAKDVFSDTEAYRTVCENLVNHGTSVLLKFRIKILQAFSIKINTECKQNLP